MSLLDLLEEREWMEVEFCRVYAEEYQHGTDGHLIRLLVAKLADLLEQYYPDEDDEGVVEVVGGDAEYDE